MIWIDILAVNQHVTGPRATEVASDDLVASIRSAETFVVLVDASGHVFQRAWCLYEIWLASCRHNAARDKLQVR